MAKGKRGSVLDYGDASVREEILVRQRREMWTPEQIASLAGHFRLAPGMAMLDAGCGFGYSLRTFGPYCLPGGTLTGLDRDESLLEIATRLAADEGLAEASAFHAGDIHAMPFETDRFDLVTAQVVMCHLDEPERALDELIRVTRPGGCIAVFDNAVDGAYSYYDNTSRATIPQQLDRCEEDLLSHRGRKKLGRGDWAVGLHMPGWMEARGLLDVDVRINERARWIAPPYRSPAQQVVLENASAGLDDDGWNKKVERETAEQLRAGGADETIVRRAIRAQRRREQRLRSALEAGTAAFAHGGHFWCIWGFKP